MKTHSQQGPSVLVVEDEPELREALVSFLRFEGFRCDGVGSLQSARDWLDRTIPDILVLDLGLPDGESITLIDSPRLANVGTVITTARGRAEDRLIGAKKGADVYLVKPIQLEELALVLRNLHRRLKPLPLTAKTASWSLQKITWTLVAPSGLSIVLTRSEVLVLGELAKSVGSGVSRDLLVTAIGQSPETYDWRRMEILIRRLRNKCKSALDVDLPVRTVHGYGYAFTEPIIVE